MARMIDGNKLVENLRLIATCWSISPFVSKEKHNGAVNMLREVEREVKKAPTLTPPEIVYCQDCVHHEDGYAHWCKSKEMCLKAELWNDAYKTREEAEKALEEMEANENG